MHGHELMRVDCLLTPLNVQQIQKGRVKEMSRVCVAAVIRVSITWHEMYDGVSEIKSSRAFGMYCLLKIGLFYAIEKFGTKWEEKKKMPHTHLYLQCIHFNIITQPWWKIYTFMSRKLLFHNKIECSILCRSFWKYHLEADRCIFSLPSHIQF